MNTRIVLIGAVCVMLALGSVASADVGDELAILTASDAATEDQFGQSVAISGNTALVGARYDKVGNQTRAGSAYLFDITTGNQLAILNASDAVAGDEFGFSVAITGNTALVGARYDDDGYTDSGSAYLFNATSGNQLVKLTAEDDAEAGDEFGFSVAISGDTAIVGTYYDVGSGFGSAYLFNATSGNRLFKLTASDGAMDDRFGYSVAISGSTAIVGALLNDDNGELNSGSAYLFDITTGNQLAILNASDAMADDHFGSSVAISGDFAIVGAYSNNGDGDSLSNSGSAYIFDRNYDAPNDGRLDWGQVAILTAEDDAAASDYFGISVGISGSTGIVGAYGNDGDGDSLSNSGSAYIFERNQGGTDNWGQLPGILTASDAEAWDNFGNSAAIDGNTAIVGAYVSDGLGTDDSGSAYLYEVPEPATMGLLLLGGLALLRRRKSI